MKKNMLLLVVLSMVLVSCSRSVTVQQAANNHYRKCRPVK